NADTLLKQTAPNGSSFHPTLRMSAALLTQYGESLENIQVANDLKVQMPEGPQVLLKVLSSSLNPLDNEMRKGYARSIVSLRPEQQMPMILGRDCVGEVVHVGNDVWDYRVGDRVWAANAPFSNGTHAQYVVMNESDIARSPANLSDTQAASVPFAALTAWNAIFNTANITSGMRVLVNGANGGVGFFSVNLLKKHLGCIVGATCQRHNFDKIQKAGADILIDYTDSTSSSLRPDVNNKFDVVLNCVDGGAAMQEKCISWLRPGGHYVSFNGPLVRDSDKEGVLIGLSRGVLDQNLKQKAHADSIKTSNSLFVPSSSTLRRITKMFEDNLLQTNVGQVFPLANIKDGYQCYMDGRSNGKIVFDHRS
ncbi:hypothetical protein SAMD00019534_062130, partial [Acytostelium subglobosum LB1]|uniref:hypothetical protein n=1 Tax=Acytostelium subglobosum LB1 TaxID=1410327 RepID=UPI000644D505